MNHDHSRRRLLLAGSLLGLLALTGCASGPTIRSNADPGVDFARFQTFNFMQPLSTDREGYQSFISRDLMAAAERELVALGLKRTDTNPDLLVNFSANLDQRLRVTQTPQPSGAPSVRIAAVFTARGQATGPTFNSTRRARWSLTWSMRPGCSSSGKAWPRTGSPRAGPTTSDR